MVPSDYLIPPPNSIVVQAGDPRIGGVICGNCKGRGRVSFFFFDENCPVYVSPRYPDLQKLLWYWKNKVNCHF